jgi:chorismate mutase
MPLWHIPIELRRRHPELPIFCDPSHIGGRRELIASISQQAMDMNFAGLFVEAHCNPDEAWSDSAQQITPDVLDYVLNLLVIRDSTQTTESLAELRRQIDGIDESLLEILAKRMRISREIGVYKKEHNMPILQTPRYVEILEDRTKAGASMELSTDFVEKILREIHEESIRQQVIVMNKK